MIDFHTHSIFSDGLLLPSELARRAQVKGYKAIAISDHVDEANIDFVVPRLIKACVRLNTFWKIKVIPAIEITHVPLECFSSIIKYARSHGIRLILVHGETVVEPVINGTNRKALCEDIDILAHPGLITPEEARLAARRNIYLELTSRAGHSLSNGHVAQVAKQVGAKLILNSDAHSSVDLLDEELAKKIILSTGLSQNELESIFKNSEYLLKKVLT
ncbi:MAG: histidinol phosphate phosphatase domain-containing protein [Candidatus Omnitrophica bacterium]|nr:histidinol phosphate phosphatase domain-containing protein [Candidatus Omnitrophota bacterium]